VAKIHSEKIEITAPFAGIITQKPAEADQWLVAGRPILINTDGIYSFSGHS